jgi:alkylation response protein AidB-like acyl-CoA dehydrogenase
MATRATAALGNDGIWRVTGDKHMGSGSGVTSFMVTFAVPEGEKTPDIFLLDTRELPWDGSRGATLVRDGMVMEWRRHKATHFAIAMSSWNDTLYWEAPSSSFRKSCRFSRTCSRR